MRHSNRSGRGKKVLAAFLVAAMITGNTLTVLAEDVSGNTVETVEEKTEETSGENTSGENTDKENTDKENAGEASEEESHTRESEEGSTESKEGETEAVSETESTDETQTESELEQETETESETQSETGTGSVSGNSVSGNDIAEETGFALTYTYDEKAVSIEGPARVEKEEAFSFRVTVKEGYTLLEVTCGGEVLSAEEPEAEDTTILSYACDTVTEDTEIVIRTEKDAKEELIFVKKDVAVGNGRATITIKAAADDENLKDAELAADKEAVESGLLEEYAENNGMAYLSHMDFGLHFEKTGEDGTTEAVQPSKPVTVIISFTKVPVFDGEVQKAELLHVAAGDGKQEKVEKAADLYEMPKLEFRSARSAETNGVQKEISFETDSFSPFPIVLFSLGNDIYSPLSWANKGTYSYVPGNSKWKTDSIDNSQPTTDGIRVDVSHVKEDGTIIYTIPAGFGAQTVNINATEDVKKLLDGSYVPGDSAEFTIKIVNDSGYTYNYVKDSFYGGTESNAYMYEEGDPKYRCIIDMSSSTGLSVTGGWVNGATGFDGSPILNYSSNPQGAGWGINRTANAALRYLLKDYCDEEDKELDFGNNGGKMQRFYTDEYLGKALERAGYTGIEQLSNYYIDYFNNIKGTNITKLEDLAPSYLYSSLFAGNRMYVRETNPEVAELGYNFFYNYGTRIVPDDTKGMAKSQFTIGNWMRNETGFEGEIESLLGEVAPGNSYELPGFTMEIDFMYISNAYMNMDFGYTFGLQLTRYNPPTPPTPPTPEEPTPGNPTPTPDTPAPVATTAVLGISAAPDVAVLGEAFPPQSGVLGESKGPGTGDSSPVIAWSLAALGAAVCLAGFAVKKKKKKQK